MEVDGNDVAGKQRVASVTQIDAPLIVQLRLVGARHAPITRLRQVQIKFGQELNRDFERFGFMPDFGGEYAQDTLDLLALRDLQFAHAVVQFYHHHRLYKDRGTAGRLVVDDAAHMAATLRLDRNNIAIVADRDNRLLQRVAEFTDQGAQAILQALVGPTNIKADLA